MNELHQFLAGFADATGLNRIEADEQWAAYSRQLSDTERERIEARGFDGGQEIGREWKALSGDPKVGGDGYVVGARCGVNHSGNHGLAELRRGHFQCQGCGTSFTAQEVLDRIASPGGEVGQGGVIS